MKINEMYDSNLTIKIKIVRCSNYTTKTKKKRWYENHIGEIFEVGYFDYYVPLYDIPQYILSDGRMIAIDDVEEIKETKMKVVEKKKESSCSYPCLKQDGYGLVVLFTQPGVGVVVKPARQYSLGTYSTTWFVESFSIYDGTLEISNGD